jgi:hypothetical protein
MVIQTQASWGAVERVEKGKRHPSCADVNRQHELTVWLIEAALRCSSKPISRHCKCCLSYSVCFHAPLPYVLSK